MPGFLMARTYNGCGHGWLAAIDHLPPFSVANLHLLNPFKNVVYPLNGIGWTLGTRFKPKGVPKLILYGDPTVKGDNSFMVVVFYINGSRLAFTRGVQYFWTCIRSIEEYSITDAVFYKGQVYAVETNFGRIVSFDVKSCWDGLPQRAKTHYTPDMCSCSRSYLVESTNGELLHVRRFLKLQRQWDQLTMPVTHAFKVYKLVFDDNGSIVQQVELKTLRDETLFVGDTQSMAVLASSFSWCKPNSIYYTSDSITVDEYLNFNEYNFNGIQCDIGIFDLEQGTATPIRWPPRNSEYEYRSQAPIWILPPINGLC